MCKTVYNVHTSIYIFIIAKFVCRKCRHLLQNLIVELKFSMSLRAENRKKEIKARRPKRAQETEISTGKWRSAQESGCESKKRNTHPSLKEIPTNGFANNQRQEDQEALVWINSHSLRVDLKLTAKLVAKSMRNSAHWSAWLGSLYIIAVDITSRIHGTPERYCRI